MKNFEKIVIYLLIEFINEIGQYSRFIDWLNERNENEVAEFVETFEN